MCAAAVNRPTNPHQPPPEPSPGSHLFAVIARTPADTQRLGAALARLARQGDVVCLQGPLGCGKTVLARGFIRQAAQAAVEVPSPTFTIVLTYPAHPAPVWHFDLYRVADEDELLELGLEEAFGTGISLIEWPERLGALVPRDSLHLTFSGADDVAGEDAGLDPGLDSEQSRTISAHGSAGWMERLRDLQLD